MGKLDNTRCNREKIRSFQTAGKRDTEKKYCTTKTSATAESVSSVTRTIPVG